MTADTTCPVCGAERGSARQACPRCGAPAGAGGDWVEVLVSADAGLVAMIGSVLDAAGIPYFVQGARFQNLFPMGSGGPGLVRRGLAARVRVPCDRADEARTLIETGAEIVDEEE